MPPSSSGLGHHPFTVNTGIRIPSGVPLSSEVGSPVSESDSGIKLHTERQRTKKRRQRGDTGIRAAEHQQQSNLRSSASQGRTVNYPPNG